MSNSELLSTDTIEDEKIEKDVITDYNGVFIVGSYSAAVLQEIKDNYDKFQKSKLDKIIATPGVEKLSERLEKTSEKVFEYLSTYYKNLGIEGIVPPENIYQVPKSMMPGEKNFESHGTTHTGRTILISKELCPEPYDRNMDEYAKAIFLAHEMYHATRQHRLKLKDRSLINMEKESSILEEGCAMRIEDELKIIVDSMFPLEASTAESNITRLGNKFSNRRVIGINTLNEGVYTSDKPYPESLKIVTLLNQVMPNFLELVENARIKGDYTKLKQEVDSLCGEGIFEKITTYSEEKAPNVYKEISSILREKYASIYADCSQVIQSLSSGLSLVVGHETDIETTDSISTRNFKDLYPNLNKIRNYMQKYNFIKNKSYGATRPEAIPYDVVLESVLDFNKQYGSNTEITDYFKILADNLQVTGFFNDTSYQNVDPKEIPYKVIIDGFTNDKSKIEEFIKMNEIGGNEQVINLLKNALEYFAM